MKNNKHKHVYWLLLLVCLILCRVGMPKKTLPQVKIPFQSNYTEDYWWRFSLTTVVHGILDLYIWITTIIGFTIIKIINLGGGLQSLTRWLSSLLLYLISTSILLNCFMVFFIHLNL